MLPRCRTADEPFVIPPFDVQVSDVEGFMDELQEFQSIFHDCFARSEARGSCTTSLRVNTRGLPNDCHKGKKA